MRSSQGLAIAAFGLGIAHASTYFLYDGGTYPVPGSTSFTIYSGVYNLSPLGTDYEIIAVGDNLSVRNVRVSAGEMTGILFSLPGRCTIIKTGEIICQAIQTVLTEITQGESETISTKLNSEGTFYANGNSRVHNGLTSIESSMYSYKFTSTTENVFLLAEHKVYSNPGQNFGQLALTVFDSAVFSFDTGATTVASLSGLRAPETGQVYTLSSPYTGSIDTNSFSFMSPLVVDTPEGTLPLTNDPSYAFPASMMTFPLEESESTANGASGGVSMTFTNNGSTDPQTFVQSDLMAMGIAGEMMCTLQATGIVDCEQPPSNTEIILQLPSGPSKLTNIATPFSFVGDGTTNLPGSAILDTSLIIIMIMIANFLALLTIIFFILVTLLLKKNQNYEQVSISESSKIKKLFASGTANATSTSVGSLNTTSLVYTIPPNMQLTADNTGNVIEATNGGQIVSNSIELNSGALLPLTQAGLAAYSISLPSGVWEPSTGCFDVPADSTIKVVDTDGVESSSALLALAATVCPSGVVTSTATGLVLGSVNSNGVFVRGLPSVPAECRDDTLGISIVLQRGGYKNAMDTCLQYGLTGVDVTNANIAAATRVLETCGGRSKSVYVGSYDGMHHGCLALYSAATFGSGTVAAASCSGNTPVMCSA